MRDLYLIPDREHLSESLALAEEFHCNLEYNDFFVPEVLDNAKQCNDIIEEYKKFRPDCSKDTIHGAFFDVTVHSGDPMIREVSALRIQQSMTIANRMGVAGVIFHTGRLAGFRTDYYLKEWKKKNLEFFQKLCEDNAGIMIYMENMFDEAPDVLADFAESMKPVYNFGVCLDYAHTAVTKVAGEEWVRTLAPYIKHMHINDNDTENDLHLPLGDGQIDWKNFAELVKKYKVDASILIEVKGLENQRKSFEFFQKHFHLDE